ncbi:RNA polymerase sigma-70 factor, ECF subfamily [Pseudomonas synxantha]|uniref:RNA polymerase sigma factor n=1 Tax=Pseudomonas synxantha TaxID=47883 RepID=A0AAX3ICB3_9PSED|nr:Sigma factor, ECF subfamily [Pseudomonas synxantha]SDU52439.1 RNA polymerase sigma-70 factor, ECF subfamily [Pseudomonas synxantha]VTR04044.1 RNA polymerase sigma factor [Pseudomonas synxantha]
MNHLPWRIAEPRRRPYNANNSCSLKHGDAYGVIALQPSNTVEVLYNDHHHWLTGWLRRKLGCPENAADLAQDTFIRVLSARDTPTLVEPRAFLTTVAKRVLFNFYRRQDLERAYLDALAQMPEYVAPSEEDRAIILQTLLELDQLLDGLPRLVKRAFLLAQLDGLTYAQISAELGISIATVKRHLTKAAMRCYFAL